MSIPYSGSSQKSEINLVEQILEQGQRLRNAMVQSIISNDPYFNEFSSKSQEFDSPKKQQLTIDDKHKFMAYLKGDEMSQNEEKEALETFRAMSNSDLCEVTEKSYHYLQTNCKCNTCRTYYKHNFNEICSNPVPLLNLKQINRSNVSLTEHFTNNEEIDLYFKHVDSLKVAVHSLKFNDEGDLKVASYFSDKCLKNLQQLGVTYFVDYEVPPKLMKSFIKKSKVDTGLDSTNSIKLCSKKLHKEAIYFKQITIHDIINLSSVNLSDISMNFQISCRCPKQKRSNVIGYAKFPLDLFLKSNFLTSNQELVVYLKDDAPLVLGTLKVTMQLGCGRLYFGKELIESISSNKRNNTLSDISESSQNELIVSKPNSIDNKPKRAKIPKNVSVKAINCNKQTVDDPKNMSIKAISCNKQSVDNQNVKKQDNSEEKIILFGFIYIAEVEFLEAKSNTYFVCHPFAQKDVLYSSVVNGGEKPFFNFCQTIPLVYEEDLINNLRDNFIIFEFYEKVDYKDQLIGICKISLHQYYLAFRNPIIVKYLYRNKQPVIGTDWYEPVLEPTTSTLVGQVQILIALGSEEQIHNLQSERGFKDYVVTKAKRTILENCRKPLSTSLSAQSVTKRSQQSAATTTSNKSKTENLVPELLNDAIPKKSINTQTVACKSDKSTLKIDTSDKASQSDIIIMDEFKSTARPDTANMGTNTDRSIVSLTTQSELPVSNNENAKKTSDLLENLQKSLKIDVKPTKDTFKAHVVISSALHLPSRKKCKAKRSKGKPIKEEILPSSYVSFETSHANDIKVTQVVQKSTNPKWDYRSDVHLPVDLLHNNQKRFIFKVWRKGNNAFLQPNMEIDTVLGFAALDLTVLAAGLPSVQGWFNIVDFASKCNGQINISVTPLENINKFARNRLNTIQTEPISTSISSEGQSETLSRTLKRKFVELDEISQRLRSRLSNITNEESDASNDEVTDEFEKDINTLCVEDDYGMLDFFTKEAHNVNMQLVSKNLLEWQNQNEPILQLSSLDNSGIANSADSSKSIDINTPKTKSIFEELTCNMIKTMSADAPEVEDLTSCTSGSDINSDQTSFNTLDQQLLEGQHRIDTLLEKLSLINRHDSQEISNRWVSGCSATGTTTNQSTEDNIMEELGIDINFDATRLFDATLQGHLTEQSINLIDKQRDEPDGEGNITDDKI